MSIKKILYVFLFNTVGELKIKHALRRLTPTNNAKTRVKVVVVVCLILANFVNQFYRIRTRGVKVRSVRDTICLIS